MAYAREEWDTLQHLFRRAALEAAPSQDMRETAAGREAKELWAKMNRKSED